MRNEIAERPESRMNRAIARPSSPTVVTLEPACHAGGRGFESRRSPFSIAPANRHDVLSYQARDIGSWPNPVAQTFSAKSLQIGNFQERSRVWPARAKSEERLRPRLGQCLKGYLARYLVRVLESMPQAA